MEIVTDFYETKITSVKNLNPFFTIRGRILRKDTNETVFGTNEFSEDEHAGLLVVEKSLKQELSKLDKPKNWNSPSRILLFKFLKFKDKLDSLCGFGFSKNDEKITFERLNETRQKAQKLTLEIAKEINDLPEKEKIELFTTHKWEIDNYLMDSLALDLLSARKLLYEYLFHPSEPVKAAYAKLKEDIE